MQISLIEVTTSIQEMKLLSNQIFIIMSPKFVVILTIAVGVVIYRRGKTTEITGGT